MKIKEINYVDIKTIHKNMDGFTILQISDLHINKKTTKAQIKNLVETCNNLDYNILVITGDIIDCKVRFIKEKLSILNFLKGKTYFISGNHDLVYGLKDLIKQLQNITFLDNSYEKIVYKDETILLAGISDRFSKFFKHKREEKNLLKVLERNKKKILLAHQPKDYKLALKSNCDLFLCGHTHGGQIWPFHYFVRIFQPFLNGLHYIKNCPIYVNKGIGTWGIDYRYKAHSEIALLRFTSENTYN